MMIFIEGYNIQGHKTGVCRLLQAGGGTAGGKKNVKMIINNLNQILIILMAD